MPHRRAVTALDVFGVYLKLRLRVDFRIIGKQEVVIGLARIRTVGALVHNGLAIPDAAAIAVEYASIFLRRCCRTHAMINACVIVNVLSGTGEV